VFLLSAFCFARWLPSLRHGLTHLTGSGTGRPRLANRPCLLLGSVLAACSAEPKQSTPPPDDPSGSTTGMQLEPDVPPPTTSTGSGGKQTTSGSVTGGSLGGSGGGSTSAGGAGGASGPVGGSSSGGQAGSTATEIGEEGSSRCIDPEPIFQAGTSEPSGFVRCRDGFIHREAPVTCLDPTGVSDCDAVSCSSDCDGSDNGTCTRSGIGCLCNYGCATDSDCAEGEMCACAGVIADQPRCVPTGCTGATDCPGTLCGLSIGTPCGPPTSLYGACLAPEHECRTAEDCSQRMHQCQSGERPQICKATTDRWYCGEPDMCFTCG